MSKGTCFVTGKQYDRSELNLYSSIKPQLLFLIRKDHPDFSENDLISNEALNLYRKKYLERIVSREHRELSRLEQEVIKAIQDNTTLSENISTDVDTNLTLGQRVADRIAEFGGSWPFIFTFFSFLLIWMITNAWLLGSQPFDPYPFILLNLILSCLAAIQAPIIMMSQNRQEYKDRIRNEQDFKVNLKAELEIRLLHEKIDHMIVHQNK